jgi:hypothetical protein
MALSYDAYPADGVTTQFDITFGYLSRSHVFVFVDDALRSYRWINGTRVELNLAPDPGQTVRVQRLTDRVTRVTDFVDGQTLLAGDLDAGDLQNFYILQEIADQVADGVLTGAIPIATASGSGTGGFVTEQWINEQLESNAYSTQAYLQLLQQITDEEVARAQAIASEAAARAAAVAQEAADRATAITAEATQRAQDVLNLEQADLAAGQRLDALESTVDTPTTGLSAKIATLETVTTDLENNKAEASVVTAIQSDLDDPTTGLKVRATSLEDRTTAVENGKADTSVTDLLDTEINDPTTGLKTRATSLENRATTLENGKAEASALTALTTRVDDAEADIVAEQTARSTADSAFTQQLNTQIARIDGAEGDITSLQTTVATETGVRVSQINAANARIDGVETDVTTVTQQLATETQARIDDIAAASAATASAQADATSALSLVATEEASRISEVSRLQTRFDNKTDGGRLLRNDRFQADEVGATKWPEHWNAWVSGVTTFNAEATGAPGVVAYMPVAAGNQGGMYQRADGLQGGGTYMVTARVRRRGGTFAAAGIFIQWRDASNATLSPNASLVFKSSTSHEGQTGETPDGLMTYTAEVTAPAGTVAAIVYAMGQYNGFGSNAVGCQIDWYEASILPLSGADQRAINAQATADSNTQLISNETAARASALDSLEAQYRSEMARHNLIPGPYRIMTEAAWMADPKMVRLYNASLYGTGIQNPWTSTDALKFDSTAGDARLAFTPDLGTDFFNRPDRLGVVMEAGRSYAGKIDVQINATHTNVALFARGNDDGGLYTIVSGTPNGGVQTLNGIFTPTVTQKYSFELRVLSPSGQINNWIYRMQVTRLFPGEIAYDVPWIDDEADTTSEAAVKVLKDALATGSASQARLFMGVNTSNNEAFLEAYAGEGDGVWNGSKIKLKADFFEFDGTAVFNQGALSAAGTAVNFTVSGTAPSSPVDGEWWADSVGGSLYIRLAGAWQLISNISLDNAFRLTGAPVVIAEAPTSSASATATTGTPGIAAVNATGTVTYAWYRVGGDASIACSNTATANPTWSGVPGAVPSTKDAAWRCVATDAATGDTAIFDTIVRLTNLF